MCRIAVGARTGRAGFACYIVPSADPHASEYVHTHWARRAWLTGFTGSAGTAVVTQDAARLWTDGRYFAQAERELDAGAGWTLMRDRLPETPSVEDWLAANMRRGDIVALDPFLFPFGAVRRMSAALEKAGVQLYAGVHGNLMDAVWGDEQPAPPSERMRVHPTVYAGVDAAEKLASVRACMRKEGVDALLVTALDEVAWLLNIRGADVECNPVCVCYCVVTSSEVILCVDEAKVTDEVRAHLGDGVRLQPYESVLDVVRGLTGRIWVDPTTCNYALYNVCTSSAAPSTPAAASRVLEKMSPIQLMKAVKNPVEIAGMREAHLRDGVALTTFFAWLEAAVTRGVDLRTGAALDQPLTEFTICGVLEGFRAAQRHFVGLSFPTIAGMGPNGAIIHYRPEAATAAPITNNGMFLCDSGAQYLDGTTDVTRTLHFGEPTDKEKHCYTRVLQGFLALAGAKFPTGASGIALDALARSALWRSGLDYRHGTGHGVGAFLNVHEGPFGAASVSRSSYDGGIVAGMTLTDEPGYYEDGAFGIRIENVLIARAASTVYTFGDKPWLEFESFTRVPITRRLVARDMLADHERAALNAYNAGVRDALKPRMQHAWAEAYLMRETEPLA